MKKAAYIPVLVVLIACLSASGQIYYSCSFEPNEQTNTWGDHIGEPAFVLGSVLDQGDPPWFGGYWNAYDLEGEVVEGEAFDGNQCMHINSYRTSDLWLETTLLPSWVEFAFKPNFDGTNPAAVAWFKTTRGPYYDMVGFTMKLVAGTGQITIVDPYGEHTVGEFINGQWQTISFRHRKYIYLGVEYLSGTIDVYLGTQYILTIQTNSTNNALGSIIFSTAPSQQDWTNCGDWYIDSIWIGESPVLAAYPQACGDFNTVYLKSDISGPAGIPDCYVDLYDLEAMAEQ